MCIGKARMLIWQDEKTRISCSRLTVMLVCLYSETYMERRVFSVPISHDESKRDIYGGGTIDDVLDGWEGPCPRIETTHDIRAPFCCRKSRVATLLARRTGTIGISFSTVDSTFHPHSLRNIQTTNLVGLRYSSVPA